MKLTTVLSYIGLCLIANSAVYALPKGKPFIELNGQIVEVAGEVKTLDEKLNDFIDDVTTRFADLDARLSTMDVKIADLEAEDDALAQQIGAILENLATNNDLIAGLLDSIEALEANIASLEADIDALKQADIIDQAAIDANQAQIAANLDEIKNLWDQVVSNAEGIATLDAQKADISLLIDKIAQAKADLQDQLNQKQNILDITCSPGQFLTAIGDGSFTCENPPTVDLTNFVKKVVVYGPWVTVPPQTRTQEITHYHCHYYWRGSCVSRHPHYAYVYHTQTRTAYASCPADSVRVDTGYLLTSPLYLNSAGPSGANGSYATASNPHRYTAGSVRATLECFVPQ